MLNTTNYGLNKPEGTDVIDIKNFNDNADIIDTELTKINNVLVYETAGGTGTAITITLPSTLKTGYSKTFIASANNNGLATTINGKPLYKPNTTTAPTLTSGKAYTVWYNATGNCFFIKASAEGNTIASHVLAGDYFSNDTDTGLIGTMPNNGALGTTLAINGSYTIPAGYTTGGTVTQSITTKAAQTYNPSTSTQTISAGQYLSGAQTINPVTGTATTAQVLSGYTFASASGIGQTGTIPIMGNEEYAGWRRAVLGTVAAAEGRAHFCIPDGYYNGTANNGMQGIFADDSGFSAANIIAGKSIFGLAGNATKSKYTTGTFVTDANAYGSVNLGFQPNGVAVYCTSNALYMNGLALYFNCGIFNYSYATVSARLGSSSFGSGITINASGFSFDAHLLLLYYPATSVTMGYIVW